MNEKASLETISDPCFSEFLILVHALSGITLGANRKSLLLGRLKKRVGMLGLESYEAYCHYVKTHDGEKAVLVDLVTTNETYFFRTPRVWQYLTEKFLPNWILTNPGKTFRVWSAAASTGAEAHTVGIILQTIREREPKFQYQILGTDISMEMVRACEVGQYKGRAIESFRTVRPELFSQYLEGSDLLGYTVNSEIKQRLQFKQHNLFKIMSRQNKFDLILLRNVLIYFTPEDQEKAISNLHPNLEPNGLLIIGESESLTHIKTDFVSVEPFIYRSRLSGSDKLRIAS